MATPSPLAQLAGAIPDPTSVQVRPPAPDYTTMSDMDLPPDLRGVTGNIFQHPGGMSTHLNQVSEHPTLPGRFTVAPMLVPGQVETGQLLAGQPASRQQFQRATGSVLDRLSRGEMVPTFNSVNEALDWEKNWHQDMEQRGQNRLPMGPGSMGLP